MPNILSPIMPPSVNCCHFPPYSFVPVTRLCLTFCTFGSPLRLTLLSALHLRPPFQGTSCVCLALSAILAPNSTQNTGSGHITRTQRISGLDTSEQGGHGTGKTGNLVLTFSRQGKHREFCCNTGKVFETQGKYFRLYLLMQKACFSLHIFKFF